MNINNTAAKWPEGRYILNDDVSSLTEAKPKKRKYRKGGLTAEQKRERSRENYRKNRVKLAARSLEYYKLNREKMKQQFKDNYQLTKEKVAARQRINYLKNKENPEWVEKHRQQQAMYKKRKQLNETKQQS